LSRKNPNKLFFGTGDGSDNNFNVFDLAQDKVTARLDS